MANEYTAYRVAYNNINPVPCVFEKAILTRCAACKIAEKHLLAERETINCQDVMAWQNCSELHKTLRTRALFILKIGKEDGELPHGKAMKIQCGGLQGLQQIINGAPEVSDIAALISTALNRYGTVGLFPYSEMARTIVHFRRSRQK